MSTEILNQLIPSVKETTLAFTELNGIPAVTSREVAKHFQRKHQHVLRDIERVISMSPKLFNASNFGLVTYQDEKGEKRPQYLLTEEAFTLVCMGFTGKAALHWKIRYIEAFKKMRRFFTEGELEALQQQAYALGCKNTRSAMLPFTRAVEREAKESYLKGLHEGRRLQKREDTLLRYKKIQAYKAKGLKTTEIAKLINMSTDGVLGIVKRIQNAVKV